MSAHTAFACRGTACLALVEGGNGMEFEPGRIRRGHGMLCPYIPSDAVIRMHFALGGLPQ